MSAGPWDSLIVGAGAEAVRIRRMDALDFYGRGTVAVQPGAQVEVVLRSDYLTALAQCDAARDIAARLEGELARVDRDIRALPGAPKAVERVSDLYGILAPFVGPHDLCSVCSVREGRDGDEFERCADCVNAGRHSAGGRGECEVCAAWADGWNKGKRIGREGALKEVVAVLDADPEAVIAEGES